MAKITKQAQEVLCEIIEDKAKAKRLELKQACDKACDARNKEFKTNLKTARAQLVVAFEEFSKKADAIVKKNHLEYGSSYRGKYTAGSLVGDDGIHEIDRLDDRLCSAESSSHEKSVAAASAAMEEFNEKVQRCKRDIMLRATLSGDYDEVMKFVDGLKF